MPRELNVLALVKGEEQYVYIYDDDSREPLLEAFEAHAADDRLSLNWFDAAVLARRQSVIASAAALDSSSRLAPAVWRPVRSATIVWKVSNASSRPWLISGWYGVYAVYQPGFSRTLRRITGGVCVSA